MQVRLLKVLPVVLIVLGLAIAGPALLPSNGDYDREKSDSIATIGNPAAFQARYESWKKNRLRQGKQDELVLPLHYSKGLSAKFTTARGHAKLNLESGTFAATITGLADTSRYDVWVVDNQPGPKASVKPEVGDRMIRLGTMQGSGNSRELIMNLNREAMKGFEVDLVVITPGTQRPGQSDLLVGSPTLFQRMYVHERTRGSLAGLATEENEQERAPAFAGLVPAPAAAHARRTPDAVTGLIARGERLFFEETFAGNGRTCGTCHPAENNFTIDPAFIATLPPRDPLFVAEFNPALAQLEVPELMRGFGLILENVDGLEDPTVKFVMRGVPHTLALPTSLNIDPPPAPDEFPQQRTGWSGDGAPNNGTLRDFAIGAVTQHFPKSLGRVPGVDFRLPSEPELDAMEAFQLSLGRQEDLSLPLPLKGVVAQLGQTIFLDDNVGKCNRCHFNAGANTKLNPLNNANFDTGVERLVDQPARLIRQFPCDGGFGKESNGTCGPESNRQAFGDNQFNVAVLVEAADTGPLFHNNAIKTIEAGVAFYNSNAFNNTLIGGAIGRIALEPTQVEAVAAFLRVINGLENIRSSIALDQNALEALGADRKTNVDRLLRVSHAEVTDGIMVLSQAGLHSDAVAHLKRARHLLVEALNTKNHFKKVDLIRGAVKHQQEARADMVRV